MQNLITAGTELLAKHQYPINEDKSIVGVIQTVNSEGNGVSFTKVWDTSNKIFYAKIIYNCRSEIVLTDHLPIAGQIAVFYRVGDFNSQGTEGFELHVENANKTSFVCFADYKNIVDNLIPKYLEGWDFLGFGNCDYSVTAQVVAESTYRGDEAANSNSKPPPYQDGHTTPDSPPGYMSPSMGVTKCNAPNTWGATYSLSYYTGYSGNGNYTGFIKNINRATLMDDQGLYLPPLHGNTSNKEELIVEEHPYLPITKAYYVQMIETVIEASPIYTGVSADKYKLSLINSIPGYSEIAKKYIHKEDIFNIQNPTRVDKNPINMGVSDIEFYSQDYSGQTPLIDYYPTGHSYAMKKRSRKSGFVLQVPSTVGGETTYYSNLPKYPYKQWFLTLDATKTGVNATQFLFLFTPVTGVVNDFNPQGSNVLLANVGSGSLVPGTSQMATYFNNSVVSIQNANYRIIYSRLASSWMKWDGSAWVAASTGDSITNFAISDTWLGVERVSNTVAKVTTLT